MQILLQIRRAALFTVNREVNVQFARIRRHTDHLAGPTAETGIAGHRRRMGQRHGIDVQKSVECAAVVAIEPPGERLFGLESCSLVGGHRMLRLSGSQVSLHLIPHGPECRLRQHVRHHQKAIPLQLALLDRSQPAAPAAERFRQLHATAMQLPTLIERRLPHPWVTEALGAAEQRQHQDSTP